MTDDEKMAYQRGYALGAKKAWPEHCPPVPPDDVIAGLMAALKDLRDECDGVLATLDPDDPFDLRLGPRIDAADAALRRVGRWLFADERHETVKARSCAASRAYYERNRDAILARKRRQWREEKSARGAA